MTLLQKIYIIVLNILFKLTGKLSDKVRDVLFVASIVALEVVALLFNYWGKLGSSFGYKELFLVNTCFLCLAILFSVKEELKPVEWNPILPYIWIIAGLLIMLPIPDMYGRGTFIMFGLQMVFLFPGFYFVWNNRGDYAKLYDMLAIATVIATGFFFLKCVFEAPLLVGAAYEGITDNSNSIGIASIGGAIASLALIANRAKTKYLYMLCFGFFVAFTIISESRASLLAIIVAFLGFLIAFIRSEMRKDRKGLLKVVGWLLLIAVCAGVMTYGVRAVLTRDEPIIRNEKLIKATEQELKREAEARQKAVAEGKLSQETAERLDSIASGEGGKTIATEDITDKFTKGNGNIESLSSGRMSTWNYYLHHIGLKGHSRKDGDPFIKERGLTAAAHNTYLEISYRSGIIPGVLYALVALSAAGWCFIYLFRKNKNFDASLVLIVLAVFAFGVMSHLERAVYPVEKVHILLYFLAITPMFEKWKIKQ